MAANYKSKVDTWLLIVMLSAVLVSALASIAVLAAGLAELWWVLLLTIGAGVILPIWVLLSTRYKVQPDRLTIRSGPLMWHIPLSEITRITPTHSSLSSPALSLDRLRIEYGLDRSIVISPQDKERFIKHVEELRRSAR